MRWVRRYFGYSRGEAKGLVLVLAIMAAAAVGPVLLRPALPVYLPAQDQATLDKLVADLKEHRTAEQGFAPRYPNRDYGRFARGGSRFPKVPQVRLAPFDPNALTAEGWEARGVPRFVAGRLVKYREAAGGFRAKSQVARVYGLPPEVFARLAPFMRLPDELPGRGASAGRSSATGRPAFGETKPNETPRFARKPARLRPFDLNLADTTQLMQIKGIGRGRAKWIVKQRQELGGYVAKNQLAEVFVLRDAPDLVDSLRKYTFVAAGFAPRPVRVNSAPFDELWPHPYVRKNLARLIVAYRQQHGPFKSAEDLRQIKILKEADFEKLRPYVRCE